VPQILGAPVGIETLSIRIYNLMVQLPSSTNQAAAVSVMLTLIVCVLLYLQRWVLGSRDWTCERTKYPITVIGIAALPH
jgi:ABC-type Fe3+ transport system permease subunit